MNVFKYLIIGTQSIISFILLCIKYFFIGIYTIITIIPRYIIIGLKFIFTKQDNTNELKKIEKKFIPLTILTLSITTYLISIFILTRWYVQSEISKNFTNDFSKTTLDALALSEIICVLMQHQINIQTLHQ